MYVFLLWSAKLLQRLSRLFGNSGAALPGLFIEKVWPRFLEKGFGKLSQGVVVVSGTNGKTTTTKIIADTLREFDEKVLTNRTGSNMTRGLISLLVSESNMLGRLPYDIAVLEVDEAYAAVLASRIPIRAALLLNVMRDQLDRFGEIDKTAEHLHAVTKAASKFVVLNVNDPRVAMAPVSTAKVLRYGSHASLSNLLVNDDDWHGSSNKKKSHIDKIAVDVKLLKSADNTLTVTDRTKEYLINSHFEGIHNHLNIAGALVMLKELLPQKNMEQIVEKVGLVKPAFGRGETIEIGELKLTLLLIKNPSSFMQTAKSINLDAVDEVVFVINDAYADSRDVSWLWDISLDMFSKKKIKVSTAGSRGSDMAVRCKYSEISVKRIYETVDDMVMSTTKHKGHVLIFCTYTAMLAIRKLLIKEKHIKQVI